MNKNKLIVALLGSSDDYATIEQHNLYIGIGPTYMDQAIIEEMKASWEGASHIDDVVVMTHIPGYRIDIVPHDGQVADTPRSGPQLFAVWIGWYPKERQPRELGTYLLNTEQYAMFILVAESGTSEYLDNEQAHGFLQFKKLLKEIEVMEKKENAPSDL